ncbi:RNA polymerase sigma factor [Pseudidiomarina halophila]|nr:RNA polymerase sigma factor [Pseudidiomarina halophila]
MAELVSKKKAQQRATRLRRVAPHTAGARVLGEQLLRCPQNAADVVQDALEIALTTANFPAPDKTKAWFFQVVRNKCIDQLRQQQKFTDDTPLAALTLPEEHLQAPGTATTRCVYQALAALPFELRDLIVLRELNDCSYKDIALIVGIPEGTVMSRLHKARLALRDEFNKRSGENLNDHQ